MKSQIPSVKNNDTVSITEKYQTFMDGFKSQFIGEKWEMHDGIYEQYSAYDLSCKSVSGTNSSLELLQK